MFYNTMQNKTNIDLKQKYNACMVLHSFGDVLGFGDGRWELNKFDTQFNINVTLEILYEFIDKGGVNQIDVKKWKSSDDTLLHISMCNAIIDIKHHNYDFTSEQAMSVVKQNFFHILKEYDSKIRFFGSTIAKYIESFDEKKDARSMPYDKLSGGNGAAMRTLCIGLMFYDDLDMLIDFSILTSQLTHNSPIGYLGGFTSAYFVYMALNNVDLKKWPKKLIKILKSNKIKKFIPNTEIHQNDYDEFITMWNKYLNYRFVDKNVVKTKINSNISLRIEYHYNLFTKNNTVSNVLGGNGYNCLIMAYDALLDAGDNWEKMIIYSAIHSGDNDTVASIACGLYGVMYGYQHVLSNNYKYIEFYSELNALSNKLYNICHKNIHM